jgi:DNA helicase IV
LIMRLLTDPDFLAAAAQGILSPEEQQLIMMNKPPRSLAAARWSVADVILIDEVADLLQRTPSRGHVIVDEAQDLSPMMLRAVGRRASTGSVTVLGDLAQATTPWATPSWRESLAHLGHPNAAITELVAGFRVPGAVIDFAARLLPQIAPALRPPHSVRRHRGELDVRPTTRIGNELVEAIRQTMRNEGTVGVIVADAAVSGVRRLLEGQQMDYDLLGEDPEIFDARAVAPSSDPEVAPHLKPILVPTALTKGLEFDHVVLLEPAEIVAGEPDQVTGLRRLYVCLTRAVTSLIVVHAADLPAALAGPLPSGKAVINHLS